MYAVLFRISEMDQNFKIDKIIYWRKRLVNNNVRDY